MTFIDAGAAITTHAAITTLIHGLKKKYALSDDILQAHDAQYNINTTTPVKAKTITLNSLYKDPSTIRVSFLLRAGDVTYTAHGRIYKNGGAVGTPRTDSTIFGTTFSEDLSFAEGDTVELWLNSAVHLENIRGYEFRILGTETELSIQDSIDDSHVGVDTPFAATNS